MEWIILAGELMVCQLESHPGWHYRTKVGNRPEQCWYDGPRMKPRKELYWAETPDIPPMLEIKEPMRFPWELEGRFKGETR
jgi:hypothetical protein